MWGFLIFTVVFLIVMGRLAWTVTRPEHPQDEFEYTMFDENDNGKDETDDSKDRE